jgi:hypothetical protein
MGGGFGGDHFQGTAGYNAEVKRLIETLPSNPDTLKKQGWTETTHPAVQSKGSRHRKFVNNQTGIHARYDKGEPNVTGFKGKDHYHVENPNATGKSDFYLDKDGNPVPYGSKKSHIFPGR